MIVGRVGMLDGFDAGFHSVNRSEKDRLIQAADRALALNDRARCIDAISQLYDLFDDDTG